MSLGCMMERRLTSQHRNSEADKLSKREHAIFQGSGLQAVAQDALTRTV